MMRSDHPGRNHSTDSSGLRSSKRVEPADAMFAGKQSSTEGTLQAAQHSTAESSESEEEHQGDDEKYVDLEDDLEKITVVSLFDDVVFEDVPSMLAYVTSSYGFDLVSVQKRFGEWDAIVSWFFRLLLFCDNGCEAVSVSKNGESLISTASLEVMPWN